MAATGHIMRVLCLLMLLWSALLCWAGRADAAANIPLHHWSYEAIERLAGMGIIDEAMVATKPYTRRLAARYVARALERIQHDQVQADGREAIAQPILQRLVQEFRPELERLNAIQRAPDASVRSPLRYGGHIQTEFDAFSVGGGQTVRLRENRGGEYYANGEINQTDVRGWFDVGDWLTVQFQPKFISDAHVLGNGATDNSKNFYIREGSIKLSFYNIAFEAGRGTQWWGQGYHGTLLLSDQAYPLDMLKLGSEDPFKIPWLEWLGQFRVNSFLTRLEVNRDFARTKVFGLRITYQPTDWMEFGLTRLTQFDGRNSGVYDFPEAVLCSYTKLQGQNPTGKCQTNEEVMFDMLVRVPKVPYLVPFPGGMQVYWELGLEDRVDHPAALAGIYIPQVFSSDSLDLRIEFADTDLERMISGQPQVWYNSATYQSGMRYRGYALGHWIGTDGIDLFVRSTSHITDRLIFGASLDYSERERSLPIHEKKREASVDLTWLMTSKTRLSVSYVFQHLNNPGQISQIQPFVETFTPITTNNNFLWTTLVVDF